MHWSTHECNNLEKTCEKSQRMAHCVLHNRNRVEVLTMRLKVWT